MINVNHRIFGLDLLRAIAIIKVVIGHGKVLLPKQISYYLSLIPVHGVIAFFVLSGFLIGRIIIQLFEDRKLTYHLFFFFLVRRWMRTLPAYFFVLFTLILFEFIFTNSFTIQDKFFYFLFIQNLNTPHPSFFSVAWSLSVEEWYYLLLPTLFYIISYTCRLSFKHKALIVCISIILFSTLVRFYKYFTLEEGFNWDYTFRKQVLTRLDNIAFGFLAAFLDKYYSRFLEKHKNGMLIIGVLIAVFAKVLDKCNLYANGGLYDCVFWFWLNTLPFFLCLPYLSRLKSNSNNKLARVITFISLISYSIYLVHLNIVQHWIVMKISWACIGVETLRLFLVYGTYWFFTFILAYALYKTVEQPFIKLRDRVFVKKV